jgi:hypothetical protein
MENHLLVCVLLEIPSIARLYASKIEESSLTISLGQYQPPPCEFNRVIMNFTVTSKGRQFDRYEKDYLAESDHHTDRFKPGLP